MNPLPLSSLLRPSPGSSAGRRRVVAVVVGAAAALQDLAAQAVDRARAVDAGAAPSALPVPSGPRTGLVLLAATATCWVFIRLLEPLVHRRVEGGAPPQTAHAGVGSHRSHWSHSRRALLVTAHVLPPVCWGGLFAHLWPMASMNDTAWILSNPIGAGVQHPIVYNLVTAGIYRLGAAMGGALAGVVLCALVQMIAWSLLIGGIVRYLSDRGAGPLPCWAMVVWCSVLPIVADYSFAVVKDAVFSLFVVALVPVLMEIDRSRGAVLRTRWGSWAAVAALVGAGVTRNNALPVVIVIAVVIVCWSRRDRRRALVVTGVSLVLVAIPTLSTAGSSHAEEALGVPLQMVGRALTRDPACLPEPSRRVMNEVLEEDTWRRVYRATSVDPVKDSPGFSSDYLDAHRGEFLRAWAGGLVPCARQYLTGYLLHTEYLWRLDAGVIGPQPQSRFTSAVTNYPANREELIARYAADGVVNHSLLPGPLRGWGEAAVRLMELTPRAGAWMWVLAMGAAGAVALHRREAMAAWGPTVLVWATLMAAAPTAEPFRYAAFVVVTVPLGLIAVFALPSRFSDRRRSCATG